MVARLAGWVSYRSMRQSIVGTIFGLAVFSATALAAAQDRAVSVCQVSLNAAKFIGKRVRVEGYITDLSSHGFVLTGMRQCKVPAQLALSIAGVEGSPFWHKAFRNSSGPKKAILVGTVKWIKPRFDLGRNPALIVDRVEFIGGGGAKLLDL